MKKTKIILASSLLLLMAACATTVRTFNPSNNDLSNYETFAYLPNTNVEVEGKNYNDEEVNRTIIESVKRNLVKHGMTVERDEPDLLVLISTSANVEVATETEPVYATYPYNYNVGTVSPVYDPYYYRGYRTYRHFVGYNTTTYTYEEGTLVIDLVDRETKRTVWKGMANEQIYDRPTTMAIEQMVDDIFAEFPVERQTS